MIEKAKEILLQSAKPEMIDMGEKVVEYRARPKELLTEIVSFNSDSDVFLVAEEVPRHDVEQFLRETIGPRDVLKSIKNGFKSVADFSFPRSPVYLGVATVLTYAGVNTLGPSWVYISMGEFTPQAISTLILSTLLLYSIPRHENATQSIHRNVYEFFRNGFYSIPLVNRAYNLTPGHRRSKVATSVVLSGLYGMGIAACLSTF